jgi:hypothetical protein
LYLHLDPDAIQRKSILSSIAEHAMRATASYRHGPTIVVIDIDVVFPWVRFSGILNYVQLDRGFGRKILDFSPNKRQKICQDNLTSPTLVNFGGIYCAAIIISYASGI